MIGIVWDAPPDSEHGTLVVVVGGSTVVVGGSTAPELEEETAALETLVGDVVVTAGMLVRPPLVEPQAVTVTPAAARRLTAAQRALRGDRDDVIVGERLTQSWWTRLPPVTMGRVPLLPQPERVVNYLEGGVGHACE